MKRTVDIIGSCVVRDCFNSKFIQEYGDYFTIKTYLPRIAIPAVMTPCVDYDDGVLAGEKTPWYYECYYKSYGKNYLSTIVNNQSDYLLIDFYSDAYLGIREYGNSYVTYMGNQKWTKSIDRSKLGRRLNYCTNASEYMSIWKQYVDRFMDFLATYCPGTTIILNGIKGSNRVMGSDMRHMPEVDLAAVNAFWKEMDEYVVKKYPNVIYLHFNKTYDLNPEYPYGGLATEFVHFEKAYYRDFFEKLLSVTTNRSIGEKSKCSRPVNLVKNGDFSLGLKYWTYSNSVWETDQSDELTFVHCVSIDKPDKIKWCWSDAIEVNGDMFTNYTLSFLIKADDAFWESDLRIFGIREFKNARSKEFGETVTYHTIEASKEDAGKRQYFVMYTFCPKTKYIRVGMNLSNAQDKVAFTNISLVKGEHAVEFEKCLDELYFSEHSIVIGVNDTQSTAEKNDLDVEGLGAKNETGFDVIQYSKGDHLMQVLDNMEQCYGCGACVNKCPYNAISMKMNDEGFEEPVVDETLCINCGACRNVCPALRASSNNTKKPVIYGVASEEKVLLQSSSGGAFTVMAEYVLKNGGAVVGAAFNEEFGVDHIVITDLKELDKLRLSKYLQSNQRDCYSKTLELLEAGKTVLYSGCPCQIAGLNNFLGKEYENLIMVDLLCHGVPSPQIFKEYLDNRWGVENISKVEMRVREGWTSCMNIFLKDGTVEKHRSAGDIFQRCFHQDIIFRRTCYNCKFSSLPRFGDITIGDLWSAKRLKLGLPYEKKSSIVLTNNVRGSKFWENAISKTEYETAHMLLSDKYSVNQFNKNIYDMLVTDITSRDRFYENYSTMDFEKAAYKTLYPYNVGLILYMSDNYGSCATNFALYKVIESFGLFPVILDNLVTPEGISLRFAKENLALSSAFMGKNDYRAANILCDAFVIGSDQSLNWDFPIVRKNLEYIMLEFAAEGKRRIGYAVSYGYERYNMDESVRALYEFALNRFDAFSVREDYAVRMGKQLFDVCADWVMDPVFLVEKEKYFRIAEKSTVEFKEPYILAYIRYGNEKRKTLLEKAKEQLGLPLIVITDAAKHSTLRYELELDNIIDKVEFVDWLAYFAHASYIITDSFHGTCFSIIFEKMYVSLKAGTTKRFDSLASMLGARDNQESVQIFEDENAVITKETYFNALDYTEINRILQVERERCRKWLRNALFSESKKPFQKDVLLDYAKLVKGKLNDEMSVRYSYDEQIRVKRNEYLNAGKTYLQAVNLLAGEPVLEGEEYTKIDNVEKYFEKLRETGSYTLLISCKDDCAVYFDKFVEQSGLPLVKKPALHNSYIAIISDGKSLYQEVSNRLLRKRFVLNPVMNFRTNSLMNQNDFLSIPISAACPIYIDIVSMKWDKNLKNQKSIISVNNIDYSIDGRGVNIAVIDNKSNMVVDTFRIDLHGDASIKMHRK